MFDWPGRKASGPVSPARFPAMLLGVEDAEPPRGYTARAREAMERNPVASRAVRLLAEAAGSAPLTIAGGDGVAALLARPNERLSGAAMMERLAAHLLLHGNAYVNAALDGGGRPAELHVLAPDRVRIETDASGWPCGFLYRGGAAEVPLPAGGEEGPGVLHIRTLSPLDDLYGLGALDAAAGAIAAHNEAARWNRALLKNAARPSGALMFDSGDGSALSTEQFARLRSEMEEGFSGAARAGRPLLLEGGLTWQPLSLSPADMDFAEGQRTAARDIALALGVPPMLLGLPGDNTYSNYAEANRALWRLSVLPMAGRICEALTGWLQGWWPDARVSVDLDKVPALAADRALMWERVSKADFLTPEEKKRVLGLAE
ncbi:phage portal protein [Pacificimonas flava]|uniref:Phage portal protein n=1 Tax=Pacificimonas flava TaxID=1234595 RepID=M2U385_9SPHN|nr:phage portal protein [Pacificimonas flava]EMD82472.1 Phage portal protein [Pacificimonas flava]MBB5281304.1 HK97 family phage portal protein [Pacificimonas flava]